MVRTPKYPRFYADVQELKNRKKPQNKRMEIKQEDIGDFNCPMDILYRIIDEEIIDLRKVKSVNTSTVNINMVFKYDLSEIKDRDRKQHLDIISMVEECDNVIRSLDREDEEYGKKRRRAFEVCLAKVKRKTIKAPTMYSLIAYALKMEGSICDRLLTVLYELHPQAFLNCFKKSEKVPRKIEQMPKIQGFSISTYEEERERNVS